MGLRWFWYLLLIFGLAYPLVIQRWHTRWGATAAEAMAALPGDQDVPVPKMASTRAITIAAPVASVWPWLVQMGEGRGGLYSYDWLGRLIGVDIHNADRIIPELQHLAVGDVVNLMPQVGSVVTEIDPQRFIVMVSRVNGANMKLFAPTEPLPPAYFIDSWVFVCKPMNDRTTRLIVRGRRTYNKSVANFLMWRVGTEPASFVIERKMLKGIKARAERVCRERLSESTAS